MRISDWSSDVCSSDLLRLGDVPGVVQETIAGGIARPHDPHWPEETLSGGRLAISCPIFHHDPSLREQLATAVGGLGLVGDEMRQSRLRDIARVVGFLAYPVPEGRAETMRRLGLLHPLPKLAQRRSEERRVRK